MTRAELRQDILDARRRVLDVIGPLADMPETPRVVRIHTLLSAAVDLLLTAEMQTTFTTELES